MIPTFLGTTLLVFTILQIAPDGPFERAVKQLKEGQNSTKSMNHRPRSVNKNRKQT